MLVSKTESASSKFVLWRLNTLVFTIDWHHCECCIQWYWPTFQGKQLEILIPRKWWEPAQKWTMLPFLYVHIIYHRIASLQMLYSWSWPVFSRVKQFIVKHLSHCTVSGCSRQICLDSYNPRRGVAMVVILMKICKIKKCKFPNFNILHPAVRSGLILFV